jgi:hypothetical protein
MIRSLSPARGGILALIQPFTRKNFIFASSVTQPRMDSTPLKSQILAHLDGRKTLPPTSACALINPGGRNFKPVSQFLNREKILAHLPSGEAGLTGLAGINARLTRETGIPSVVAIARSDFPSDRRALTAAVSTAARGLPMCFPMARACAIPARTLSAIRSLSN